MSRNVVLVTYDSLRADHCGFMGYERETTPTLDEMAEEGVVFENAVAAGVPTIASMTAVMTGQHSLATPEIGRTDAQRREVTSRRKIAEVLAEAGYATGALTPNPPASSYFGFDGGFDWFEDFLGDSGGPLGRLWNRVFRHSIEGSGPATYLRLARNVLGREEVLRPWESYYGELLDWRARVEEPYFLWVLLLEPHHPWFPPTDEQHWSSRWDKYRSFRHYWEMLDTGWQPDFSPGVRRRLLDLYDDSIRYGDAFIDRLRTDLVDDDPVFVVHADHGEEFGGHGRYGHQPHLYESLIHVPLVVSGLDRSGRIGRPVDLRQVAPTVADVAGVSHAFEPSSLLDSNGRPWATAKVFADGGRRAAIRTRSGKYIADGDREELYALATDSAEQSNLLADDADAEPGGAPAFRDALRLHVGTETDKRAVRAASRRLGGETL